MCRGVQGDWDRMASRPGASELARSGTGRKRDAHGGPPSRRSATLWNRERDVLGELVKGTSTEEIAAKFHVSPHTVRTHIKNTLRKLEAHTRAHAVAIAMAEEAIDAEL